MKAPTREGRDRDAEAVKAIPSHAIQIIRPRSPEPVSEADLAELPF